MLIKNEVELKSSLQPVVESYYQGQANMPRFLLLRDVLWGWKDFRLCFQFCCL